MTAKTAKPAETETKVEAAVQPNPCKCECGQITHRPTALYVAGHDARHAGIVGRSAVSDDRVKEIFASQPKLAAKALRVRETAARKAAEKAAAAKAREAAKVAAKLAYDAALAAK